MRWKALDEVYKIYLVHAFAPLRPQYLTNFSENFGFFKQKIEISELCKGVHCVDLGESFQTHILLQNLASIQKRTSSIKFDHLAEKSEKGSISNLSTKAATAPSAAAAARSASRATR